MRAWCRVILKKTVVRRGGLAFCISKSSKGSREHELAHTVGEKGRLGPAWRDRGATQAPIVEAAGANERVWGEKPDTDAYSNGKAGLILLDLRSTLSSKGLESDDG